METNRNHVEAGWQRVVDKLRRKCGEKEINYKMLDTFKAAYILGVVETTALSLGESMGVAQKTMLVRLMVEAESYLDHITIAESNTGRFQRPV